MNLFKAIYYRVKAHECYKRYDYWARKTKASLDTDNMVLSLAQMGHALYWLEQQVANYQKKE